MPRVKPFRGVRPPQALVEEVESRPYDVLDSDEARVEAGNNEKSLYHIIKPEINFPEGTSEYDPRVYESGADQFKKFQQEGWLVQDNEENYYLYAQTMNGKTQYGIVLCCHVDDYMTNANIEPVFLAYKSSQPLIDLIDRTAKETPVYDFVAPIDHFRHQFWVIADPKDKEVITTEFDKMDALYIADGHHRSAAAALVGAERAKQNPNNTGNEEYNFYMAVCFPAEQLTILDYNRVVKDLNGLTKDEFLKALGKNFIVEDMGTENYRPKKLHEFSAYLEGHWYRLEAKEGTFNPNDPIGVLDVDISSRLILDEILGITDLRGDKRIDFVGGLRGLEELKRRVDNGEMKFALALYPVTMEQIMNIADSGKIMPPKATWFEPKLRSGLVIHKLD